MKLHIALLASLTAISLFAQGLYAQDANPATPQKDASAFAVFTSDVKPFIDQFFAALQHDDIDKAYEALTAGSNIASQTKGLEALKTKTSEAIKTFGEIHGYDVSGTKWIGTHLVRVTCISLGASHPLRWRFYFYKGGNGWKLIDIGMNARIGQIFDEEEDTTTATTN